MLGKSIEELPESIETKKNLDSGKLTQSLAPKEMMRHY